MTMQEALEIIAMSEQNKGDFGMTPEEQERRQALIRNLATSNPDLARDVAKGPYRINVGNSQPGDTATPTEAWTRGPSQGSSYSDQVRSQPQPSQMQGRATPSTTGPVVAGMPPPRYNEPGMQSGGSIGTPQRPSGQYGPQQGPLNPNGQYGAMPGQMPTINIHVGGQPQQSTYRDQQQDPPWGLPSQASRTPQHPTYGGEQQPIGGLPSQASRTPGFRGPYDDDELQSGGSVYEPLNQWRQPIPPNPYNNGAYNNSHYPMSPMWSGR